MAKRKARELANQYARKNQARSILDNDQSKNAKWLKMSNAIPANQIFSKHQHRKSSSVLANRNMNAVQSSS